MNRTFYVYILASQRNGTLYAGMTSDLVRRLWEHKEKVVQGFTATYGVESWSIMNSMTTRNLQSRGRDDSRNGIELGS
jgi:predicted GIY-YIG superfamily endonuclease